MEGDPMRKTSFIRVLALLPALTVPAQAQSQLDERRWDDAQARYREETAIYERERDRYMASLERSRDRDRYRTDYDAARDYREDADYEERRLSAEDEVFRGSDGRYYCKRS